MTKWKVALRAIARRPGYSITAILMLVLGIGATTSLFSVVDTILLKPLPYPNPDRLVTLMEASPSKNKKESLIAPVRIEDWNRLNQTFESIAGIYTENVTDTGGSEPQRLAARRVSPRYFTVVGSAPLLGRTFSPQEEVDGGPTVAVISYSLWTRRFGQDAGALGKRLVLGGRGYTIIGVMPREFTGPSIDAWLPAQTNAMLMRVREARFHSGVGRMKPGVTMAQAQADLARVQQQLGEQFPRTDKGWSALVGDLKEQRVGSYRRTLLLVFGAVGMLFLIAVANIAGLTLAQLNQREREMAIRSSIGASRGQVIAAVMRESLLIAATGVVCGGALAAVSVSLMAKIFAALPRMSELRFDWRAASFMALAGLLSAAIFGAIPAMQATRVNLASLLGEGSRGTSGGRRSLQRGLVVAQLAVTVLLLSSAGLLLRSYFNLSRVDTGFSTAGAFTFHVGAAWDEDRPRVGRLQLQILDELRRTPGVEAAGFANFLPATGATLRFQVQLEGMSQNGDSSPLTIGSRTVTPGYLKALHVPLLAGSWCEEPKPFVFNSANKSMVNRRFVEQYAQGQNIVGRHFSFSLSSIPNAPSNEIVGVIGDVREDGLAADAAPYVYDCPTAGSWPDPEYVVRANGDPRALMQSIRAIVHGIDSSRAVFGVKLLDSVVDDALEQPRLNVRFLGVFAAAALLLAAVGLYSLISLIAASRTRELGVRMALGASQSEIMRLVFSGAGRLVVGGIIAGLILTLIAERLIRTLLFGIGPLDVLSLAGAIAVLAAVSSVAAFVPARRAARIDPLKAIRAD